MTFYISVTPITTTNINITTTTANAMTAIMPDINVSLYSTIYASSADITTSIYITLVVLLLYHDNSY